SLHFERSYWVRAYSYASIEDRKWNKPIPKNDGILKLDLENGSYETILPIEKIVEISEDSIPGTSSHWIEHIMLNRQANRFAFYHRYGSNENFKTNLLTADCEGKNIWLHPGNKDFQFTHLGWKDKDTFAIYTIGKSKSLQRYNKIQRKSSYMSKAISFYRNYLKRFMPKKISHSVLQSNNYYALIKDQTNEIETIESDILNRDGHPSFSKDGRYMLTDTYEDKNSYRHLLLYDTILKQKILLGKFYSSFNSTGWRADLHPRFSIDDNRIVIDSAHTGRHQVMILRINWDDVRKQLNPNNS
ncbi:MAG: hypothetical protein MI922_05240, partial [Bacteroidales bacterium]|nr:hypothetical protein [Bacteroidales bacterium]